MNREDGGSGRLVLGLVFAVTLAVLGGVVLAGRADRGGQEALGAFGPAAGASATTRAAPPSTDGPGDGVATTAPASTSTSAAVPDRITIVPGRTATTVRPPGPTTSAPTATSLRTVPESTTTTVEPGTNGAPGPACVASMFDARLTLDKQSYRPGETVRGTATFTNVSGTTCFWASSTGTVDVLDPTGQSVTYGPTVIRDGFHWIPFAPGEVFTHNPTWDQQACPPSGLPMPCGQAAPGAYTLVVIEQPYGTARASFQLTAA